MNVDKRDTKLVGEVSTGEMLRLKTNWKLGFTGKERQTGKMLRLKTNWKLGSTNKERQTRL